MQVFYNTLNNYITTFSLNKIIMLIMIVFMIIGAIDRIIGNKYGYGQKFEEGYKSMGILAESMVGIIVLVPVIKILLGDLLGNFFFRIGADPSLFAGIILGTDLGGYPLAIELAQTEKLGYFTGLIVASVMGINIVFNIPVGMSIIKEEDRKYLALGMLLGFSTVPIACVIGGFTMILCGYSLSINEIVMNTIPVAGVAILIILGISFAQNKVLKIFFLMGDMIRIIATFGTAVAVFQYLTGIYLPLFSVMVEPNQLGVVPIENAVQIVGGISFVLLGAFPLVKFVTDKFQGSIIKIGKKFNLDENSIAGLIANLANNIPMFQLMKDMNNKGKVLNCAFTVSSAFVLGDHLGFCASVNQQMIVPMIAAKLSGGVTALIIANIYLCKHNIN